MKKGLLLFAMGVMFTLMACGSGSTTNEGTDSTAVVSDTVTVSAGAAVDSVGTIQR